LAVEVAADLAQEQPVTVEVAAAEMVQLALLLQALQLVGPVVVPVEVLQIPQLRVMQVLVVVLQQPPP
jgi:hypothetical protein